MTVNTQTNQTPAATVLTVAGVISLIAAAIAFVVVNAQAKQRKTDYMTGRVGDALSGATLSAYHVPGGNYTVAIALAIVGVVLITWGLIARRA